MPDWPKGCSECRPGGGYVRACSGLQLEAVAFSFLPNMKLSNKLEKVLNDQINLELCSAYAYFGMAAYFERTAFTGFGKWMQVQSKEELGHANRFFKYIVERGGKVALRATP